VVRIRPGTEGNRTQVLSPLHIRPVPTRSTDRSRIATPTRGRFRSNPRPKPSLDVFVTRCRHGKARAVPRPGSDRGLVGPRASYLPPAQAAPARSDRSSHHGYSFSVLPQLVLKTKMSHRNKIHKPRTEYSSSPPKLHRQKLQHSAAPFRSLLVFADQSAFEH